MESQDACPTLQTRILTSLALGCPLLTFFLCSVFGAEHSAAAFPQPAWGKIFFATNSTGQIDVEVRSWPVDGKLSLPTPFPNITAAHWLDGRQRVPLKWVFNADATQVDLELPTRSPATSPAKILLETTETTQQYADGRIVFSALDAKVHGTRAKLESHPGNHRIGFWTDAGESVTWEHKPTRWGKYQVEFTFSADGGADTELLFAIAGQNFTVIRPATGSWYRYQTLQIGPIYLPKADPFPVRVSCRKMTGVAVMNLKAVTLRPAPEGEPAGQDAAGLIALRARDAVTHSVMMRYEPAPNKNCLGYWTNPNDWAEWEFAVTRPGLFDIEIWQGCGKGQGGSDVSVEIADKRFAFVVQDTGHFQNFVPRRLGQVLLAQPGVYSLAVKPLGKRAAAVMDVRELRLTPAPSAGNAPPAARP
jgi:hypothetical protein